MIFLTTFSERIFIFFRLFFLAACFAGWYYLLFVRKHRTEPHNFLRIIDSSSLVRGVFVGSDLCGFGYATLLYGVYFVVKLQDARRK